MGRISAMMMMNAARQSRQREQHKREQRQREQRQRQQKQRQLEQRQRQQQKKPEKYVPYRNEKYTGDRDTNGTANGEGTFVDICGNIYEGAWKNGKRHGYGIQDWKRNSGYNNDEHIYYGYWKDNIMHGKGVMYDVITHQRKCGYWDNGVYQKRSPRLMNLRPENNGLVRTQKYKYKKPSKVIKSNINHSTSYENKKILYVLGGLYFLAFLLFIFAIMFILSGGKL